MILVFVLSLDDVLYKSICVIKYVSTSTILVFSDTDVLILCLFNANNLCQLADQCSGCMYLSNMTDLYLCILLLAESKPVFLSVLSRLTDTKWRSATMRQLQTLQITKWRASSRKPTSFPECFGESKKDKEEEVGEWRSLTVTDTRHTVKDELNSAYWQVGQTRPWLSTGIWRPEGL